MVFLTDFLGLGYRVRLQNEHDMRLAVAWLAAAQDATSDGGVSTLPQRADLVTPLVFDTGQTIFGLIGAFHETRAKQYLDSAIQAAQGLISIQDPTGT
jgi:hypothetical protein